MWLDPDMDPRNGIMMQTESDMLRLDSIIMLVQLSIRQLLEVYTWTSKSRRRYCMLVLQILQSSHIVLLVLLVYSKLAVQAHSV